MKRPNKIERMNAYLYAWAILTGRIEDPWNPKIKGKYNQEIDVLAIDYLGKVLFNKDHFYAQLPDELESEWIPELLFIMNKGGDWPHYNYHNKELRITALENAIKLLA